MKFDCQNWQISICSGNPLNISFNLFDMKYFQRKLMISGKSTNTSFHLFWLDVFSKEINDLWKFFQSNYISFVWLGLRFISFKAMKRIIFLDKISFQIHQSSKISFRQHRWWKGRSFAALASGWWCKEYVIP